MAKTLDLIKRFDQHAYDNTKPFKQALVENPNTKTFAIVSVKGSNTFAFIPSQLRRFVGNKTIIGTIERPRPEEDPYACLRRTAEHMFSNFDVKEQYHDNMKAIIDMGMDDKYLQTFQAMNTLVKKATEKDEALEKQARDLRERFLDSFTQYTKTQVDSYKKQYKAEHKYDFNALEYITVLNDLGFKFSDVTGAPQPTLNGKLTSNVFVISSWLDGFIPAVRDSLDYDSNEIVIEMKLDALKNGVNLLIKTMTIATFTAFHEHYAEIMGLYAMLTSQPTAEVDQLLDLL